MIYWANVFTMCGLKAYHSHSVGGAFSHKIHLLYYGERSEIKRLSNEFDIVS